MKTIHTISLIAVFAAASVVGSAQDYPDEYLGLPGDNLNLYAVMNLFQESETLEGFERSLNDQETTINNLDLNGDNLIDYITVSDYVDEEVHNIVLRAALNSKEQQDIAVFVVEKLNNGEVQIQLIGDEALYGRNYIVEPIYAETPNPGYTGDLGTGNAVVNNNYYNIGHWPVVRYVYHPRYVVWRSAWYWGYYPGYWNPWRPHYYHYYYGYHSHWNDHYYRHYRHWDHYRCRSYNNFYHSHVRVHSSTVVVNINNGRYKSTYSRPDRRSAGEEHYARTASSRTNTKRTAVSKPRSESRINTSPTAVSKPRSNTRTGTVSGQQGVHRTADPSNRSRSGVSTSQRKPDAVRGTSTQRTNPPRTGTTRTSPNRSADVQRSSNSRSSKPAVSKSSSSRSSKPAVSKSSSSRSSKPAVSKSSSSRSSKGSSAQRSQSSKSKSPAKRSSSSSKKSRSSSGR